MWEGVGISWRREVIFFIYFDSSGEENPQVYCKKALNRIVKRKNKCFKKQFLLYKPNPLMPRGDIISYILKRTCIFYM